MLARINWRTLPGEPGGAAGAARYPTLTGAEPWLAEVEQRAPELRAVRLRRRACRRGQGACARARASTRSTGDLLSWYGPRAVAGLAYLRTLAEDNRAQRTPDGALTAHGPDQADDHALAIVNPLGVVPFFIHYTQGCSRGNGAARQGVGVQRVRGDRGVRTAGAELLEFFGISIASFQVGGGMLLLMSSLSMLNAQPAEKPRTEENQASDKASLGASIAVVPLTIPLLTGPATMSTVVIYAEKARHVWELAVLVGYGVVIGLATGRVLPGGPIARVIGKTGINVMTRLMGLILAALAVEVMADGLGKLFPVLATTVR